LQIYYSTQYQFAFRILLFIFVHHSHDESVAYSLLLVYT
jgi:hypothetical protein